MAKKSMKAALANTLKAEDKAVRDRFEKADSLLEDNQRQRSIASVDAELASTGKGEVAMPTPNPPQKLVVRDGFSMPADDYELIALIQRRCLDCAVNVTKAEVLRAGLKLLHALSDEHLLQAIENLEKVKAGRPGKKA